jgi:hypothetical protein
MDDAHQPFSGAQPIARAEPDRDARTHRGALAAVAAAAPLSAALRQAPLGNIRPQPLSCRHAIGERPDVNRPMTLREIARTIAGAVTSLVIVGWLVFFAIALLSAR